MFNQICSYGCGQFGQFRKNGRDGTVKWACVENIQRCPAMRDRARQKTQKMVANFKETGEYDQIRQKMIANMKTVSENGQSKYAVTAEKIVETRKQNNSYVTGAAKSAKTKKSRIDPCSGLTIEKTAVIKANLTRTAIDDTGTSIAQRAARKGIQTRMTTIDPETGLTIYETGELRAKRLKPYKGTKIFYGSSYELKWIEQLVTNYGLEWVRDNVRRGPNFRYWDPEELCWRNYPSDFVIAHTLYEIKSDYYFAKNQNELRKNTLKLDEALSQGWIVKLVLNHVEYDWSTDRNALISLFR